MNKLIDIENIVFKTLIEQGQTYYYRERSPQTLIEHRKTNKHREQSL